MLSRCECQGDNRELLGGRTSSSHLKWGGRFGFYQVLLVMVILSCLLNQGKAEEFEHLYVSAGVRGELIQQNLQGECVPLQLSADGDVVLLVTTAQNLTDNAPPLGMQGFYLYDVQTEMFSLVNQTPSGEPFSDATTLAASLSADGQRVLFSVRSYDLATPSEMYLFDLSVGTTRLLQSGIVAKSVRLSADGHFAAFFSQESKGSDLFFQIMNVDTGEIVFSSSAIRRNKTSALFEISDDFSRAYINFQKSSRQMKTILYDFERQTRRAFTLNRRRLPRKVRRIRNFTGGLLNRDAQSKIFSPNTVLGRRKRRIGVRGTRKKVVLQRPAVVSRFWPSPSAQVSSDGRFLAFSSESNTVNGRSSELGSAQLAAYRFDGKKGVVEQFQRFNSYPAYALSVQSSFFPREHSVPVLSADGSTAAYPGAYLADFEQREVCFGITRFPRE
ncbi:hypothetical protein MRY87_10855 [bacterium]|nr:hypothetical protein [bacterium]